MKKVNLINGFENINDYYYVTTCGKILSMKSKLKILKGAYDKDGYRIISFRLKCGKNKTLKVHRVVALAFIKNENLIKDNVVNHKDEVKCHNWVQNLEWCTEKYNTKLWNSNRKKS